MVNALLGILLVAGPVAGYFLRGRSTEGLLIGLGLAAIVICIYIVLERVPLDMLVFGTIGAVGGLIITKVMDWLIFKTDSPVAYNFMQKNIVLVNMFECVARGLQLCVGTIRNSVL